MAEQTTDNQKLISFDVDETVKNNDDTDTSGTTDELNRNMTSESNLQLENENIIDDTPDNLSQGDVDLQSDDGYNVSEIYTFLKDSGIAPEVEDLNNIKDINDVARIIDEHRQKVINDTIQKELEEYPQNYKDLFEYVKNGGKVDDFVNNYKDSYTDLDINSLRGNTELQEKAIFNYYKATTNWDDDFIKTNVDKFSNDEKVEMSKKAVLELKNIESYHKQQLIEQQQQQQQQAEEYRKQMINEYNKNIDEMKVLGNLELTIKDKNEIKDYLFNDVTYNKLNSDFEKYRLNLAILDKYGLLDDPSKLSEMIGSGSNKKYNFKRQSGQNKQSSQKGDGFDFDLITESLGNQGDKIDLTF